jgi:hypothetical protein
MFTHKSSGKKHHFIDYVTSFWEKYFMNNCDENKQIEMKIKNMQGPVHFAVPLGAPSLFCLDNVSETKTV